MEKKAPVLLLACGALAREVLAVVEQNGFGHMRVECLPAKLHNRPERIPEEVRRKIRARRAEFDRIVVLYSDCGTGGALQAVLDEEGVEGIGGAHCYEVFTGAQAFAGLMEAEPGTFFLTDFLARHFETLIVKGMGIDRHPQLRDIYFHSYRKLVYLAQVEDPVAREHAAAAAQFLGLEFETRVTGYGGYQTYLASL